MIIPSQVTCVGSPGSTPSEINSSQYSTSKSSTVSSSIQVLFPEYKWRARTVPTLRGNVVVSGFLNSRIQLVCYELNILGSTSSAKSTPVKARSSTFAALKFFENLQKPIVHIGLNALVDDTVTRDYEKGIVTTNKTTEDESKRRAAEEPITPPSSKRSRKTKITIDDD